MSTHTFSFKDSSLSAVDLIPPDDGDDEDQDDRWREYCRVAATINRARILEVVLSDLDAEDSPLYEFIDEALCEPHEPGRAKDSLTKLARLGQSLLNLIAKAVDDQVNLRQNMEVPHD
jgi:hypothetical protein